MKYDNQEQLENAYHHKEVRYKDTKFGFPKGFIGKVTACLFKYEDGDTTIMAVMGRDYKLPENPCWCTYKLSEKELDEFTDNLELV